MSLRCAGSDSSSFFGSPLAAGTLNTPLVPLAEVAAPKMIVSSSPQLRPRGFACVRAMAIDGPPVMETFLSSPDTKNATHLPSGESAISRKPVMPAKGSGFASS